MDDGLPKGRGTLNWMAGRSSSRGFATQPELTPQNGEPLGPVPDKRLVARVLGQIEEHLRFGRWSRAFVALTFAEQEVREREGMPDLLSLPVTRRRERPLWDLPLKYRTSQAVETAGSVTVGDVLDRWPHGFEGIPNVGEFTIREIGLALIAWQLLGWEQLQGYCAGQKIALRPTDVPQIDRLGERLIDDEDE
jgi:hypothetical protein